MTESEAVLLMNYQQTSGLILSGNWGWPHRDKWQTEQRYPDVLVGIS